uniref:TF-B3 domain-containing protein n=1 Tax=Glycine max TaxID=3847 RepID=A0A0R0EK95_SOYBN
MASTFPHQLQVKPIHFFKIITAQNLQDGKLMIPNKYVDKYGEGLPNSLFLKTPNGTEWNFNLKKRDGKIWFQKGWKEFAEYHSLAHGHLLVFRRHRTSHFQVHIFDLSALEIHYPSKGREGKMSPNHQGNNPRNEENLEYHKPGQKRKDNTSLKFLQPYISNENLLTKFCRRHFGLLNKKRHINLQVLNWRIWPGKLTSGWKAFVKDNNLKVGNVCTFELIDGTKLTFLVHIFKGTKSSNCSTSQGRIDV